MKANCASLTLYHFAQGHHREVCVWHDQDHKPEVVGTVPGIFISQRWVAPPQMKALWPPSSLNAGGGEYVNLYWTTTTPDDLRSDTELKAERPDDDRRRISLLRVHGRRGDAMGLEASLRRLRTALVELGQGDKPQTVRLLPNVQRVLEEVQAEFRGRAENAAG